jgi:hypothetical protein
MKNIYQKLANVKDRIENIPKNSENPFFKSKYLDLNGLLSVVEPELHKERLLLLQPIIDGVVYSKIVDLENVDDFLISSMSLSENKDPQKLGSEITYYRRYTLQSLLSLQAVDDDGNLASKNKSTPSNDHQTPIIVDNRIEILLGSDKVEKAREYLRTGEGTIDDLEKLYKFDEEVKTKLLEK